MEARHCLAHAYTHVINLNVFILMFKLVQVGKLLFTYSLLKLIKAICCCNFL